MLRLSEMNELAAGARSVGRDPVKTVLVQIGLPELYPLEWISKGPGSNLEGGLVPGGRSSGLLQFIPFSLR